MDLVSNVDCEAGGCQIADRSEFVSPALWTHQGVDGRWPRLERTAGPAPAHLAHALHLANVLLVGRSLPIESHTAGLPNDTIDDDPSSGGIFVDRNITLPRRPASGLEPLFVLALVLSNVILPLSLFSGQRDERNHVGRKSVGGEKPASSEFAEKVVLLEATPLQLPSAVGRANFIACTSHLALQGLPFREQVCLDALDSVPRGLEEVC